MYLTDFKATLKDEQNKNLKLILRSSLSIHSYLQKFSILINTEVDNLKFLANHYFYNC